MNATSFGSRLPFSVACLAGILLAAPAPALPQYEIVALGLFDADHTSSSGTQVGSIAGLGDSGTAAGTSQRFDGGTSFFGQSAWFYEGASTTRVGFVDATHTRDDGYQVSSASRFGAGGFVAGRSERYAGSEGIGWSAWRYDGAATVRLGFFDADHVATDGRQDTSLFGMNDSGAVIGTSRRYDGNASTGSSAWLYDGVTTTRLGFIDGVHVAPNGGTASNVTHITNSGFVAGHSTRIEGGPLITASAWVYDGTSTTRVGYSDAAHTLSDGSQDSDVLGLTETGVAFGTSLRALGGASAWLDDGTTITRVGLLDAAHTNNAGLQSSIVWRANDAGHAAGESIRLAGASTAGRSTWFFDGTDSVRIGLFDADHTSSTGSQTSFVGRMNAAGLVIGTSERYGAFIGGEVAQSGWLYDGTATTRLGLLDATHTRADGFQEGGGTRLNDAGLVAGFSTRYDGNADIGQTAWIYDSSTDEYSSIVLSTGSDGYASSNVSFLDDSGFALGSYLLIDENDNWLGGRAFAWTPEDGAVDLGFFVEDLTEEGWSLLASALRANGAGQILGLGRLLSHNGQVPFLLTPIPEPGTAALLLVGLLGIAARSRTAGAQLSD